MKWTTSLVMATILIVICVQAAKVRIKGGPKINGGLGSLGKIPKVKWPKTHTYTKVKTPKTNKGSNAGKTKEVALKPGDKRSGGSSEGAPSQKYQKTNQGQRTPARKDSGSSSDTSASSRQSQPITKAEKNWRYQFDQPRRKVTRTKSTGDQAREGLADFKKWQERNYQREFAKAKRKNQAEAQ